MVFLASRAKMSITSNAYLKAGACRQTMKRIKLPATSRARWFWFLYISIINSLRSKMCLLA